ncbi:MULTISPECIES: hypothetical protein [unclassified Pseudomonas]|uniref:hypothetical protein n=1 Tax=unclassified Pseudomonas TaxID=196821 RepID=UPI002AC966BB|nr:MULTISPECIES: hypothetical protein [unclassified Pseudomonas]MEB0040099.1 hypothetical protein [Pseudomonas sp. MH10]MEB0122292.1 hypothetical protein [Pseudomonas sp. CCI1.2]WPX65438.1 hypothetical protein RHM59_07245 [Pseudomonas sp. MH10]
MLKKKQRAPRWSLLLAHCKIPIYWIKGRELNILQAGAIAAVSGICGLLGQI